MSGTDLIKVNISYLVLNNENIYRGVYISTGFRICLILEGKALWEIGGCTYQVQENNIVLLNNTEGRSFKHIADGKNLRLLIIEFEPYLILSSNFFPLFKNNISNFSPVISEPCQDFSDILSRIQKEDKAKAEDYETLILANVISLLVQVKRYYKSKGCNFKEYKCSQEIIQAISYIDDNFCDDIKLQTVAGLIPMSVSAFSKLFLKNTGIGFNQYIRRKRIEKAIHLLETTDETILSIAMKCGFKNGANFYKAFNQIAGTNPKTYRH